jgi:hypothetical protein
VTREIRLNAFEMNCITHQSPGLWRHPRDRAWQYKDLDYWTDLARILEGGKFDAIFIADVLGVYDVLHGDVDAAIRHAAQIPVNDPLQVVPPMAAVTRDLGFGLTASVSFEHPYPFARRFSTLDHLTKGRAAWNIVTSYLDSRAKNIGLIGQVDHDEHYEVAEEYLEVCYKLWEGSWEDGTVQRDKARDFRRPRQSSSDSSQGALFRDAGRSSLRALSAADANPVPSWLFAARNALRGQACRMRLCLPVFEGRAQEGRGVNPGGRARGRS